jgi:hypothetical protein
MRTADRVADRPLVRDRPGWHPHARAAFSPIAALGRHGRQVPMKLFVIVAVMSATVTSGWAEPLPLASSGWDIRYSDGPAHPSASPEAGWDEFCATL